VIVRDLSSTALAEITMIYSFTSCCYWPECLRPDRISKKTTERLSYNVSPSEINCCLGLQGVGRNMVMRLGCDEEQRVRELAMLGQVIL
jgi:hypothetical protein